MHRILRAAAALTAAGGLLALAGPASASEHGAAGHRIMVVGNGSSVRIDHTTVHAGTISFEVLQHEPRLAERRGQPPSPCSGPSTG